METNKMETNKVWYAKRTLENHMQLAMIESKEHAYGEIIDLEDNVWEALHGNSELIVKADVLKVEGKPRVSVITPGLSFKGETPIWFTLINDTRDDVPAILMLAFLGGQFPEGAVTSLAELKQAGIDSKSAAASVRWLVGSGVVHEVKVAPDFRRQKIASRLLLGVELLCKAHSWPGLNAGDERTQEGDALVRSFSPELTHGRIGPWFTVIPPPD